MSFANSQRLWLFPIGSLAIRARLMLILLICLESLHQILNIVGNKMSEFLIFFD